jgi:isopentenyl-diphosphate delta-isomerase
MHSAVKEEWFDVVDEQDRVIGRELRSVVHARGLNHRAVHILLFNLKDEVFLQLRSPLKDNHPNVWDSSCSGHVDSGEDYDTAANRELEEELGISQFGKHLALIGKIDAREETGREFVHVYRGRHEGPFRLHPDEISEGRFFPSSEVRRALEETPEKFAPAFRYLWPLFFSRD